MHVFLLQKKTMRGRVRKQSVSYFSFGRDRISHANVIDCRNAKILLISVHCTCVDQDNPLSIDFACSRRLLYVTAVWFVRKCIGKEMVTCKTRNTYAFARSQCITGRASLRSEVSLVDVADYRISVASQDIFGAVYPQILT